MKTNQVRAPVNFSKENILEHRKRNNTIRQKRIKKIIIGSFQRFFGNKMPQFVKDLDNFLDSSIRWNFQQRASSKKTPRNLT